MIKAPGMDNAFAAMKKRLSGAKTNKPMKPPKSRPKAQGDFIQKAMLGAQGG